MVFKIDERCLHDLVEFEPSERKSSGFTIKRAGP
jgi:hypothetical protein